LPALFFAGAVAGDDAGEFVAAALGGGLLAPSAAGRGFQVQLPGLRRAAPLAGECLNDDFVYVVPLAYGQRGSHFDIPADLAALAVVVDLATLDRMFGERAGLEKARRPQPFVESHMRGGRGRGKISHGWGRAPPAARRSARCR